jgi:prepilin-type N-terminal cleavage/methylation domain-containing protein
VRCSAAAQCAFTLIEMLVVLALGAIMATIVTVSLTGSMRTARAEDAAGRIATYDRLAREHARRFGKAGSLVFDLDRATFTLVAAEEDHDSRDNVAAALHLPSGIRIGCVVAANGSIRNGQASIQCSSDGQTPSYAVDLTDGRGEHYWMVVAGLTGKAIRVSNEQEIQDIFLAMRGGAVQPTARNDTR